MITSEILLEDPGLIDLIDKFMARLPAMRDSINFANAEKNDEEFSNLIHQLKGVGGGYGYPMLTEICANIEVQIKENNTDSLESLLKEFNQMAENILAGSDENHKIAEANK